MNKINIVFLCNFKPNWTFKKNFKKKIFCKNFIVFIMFLKFFKKLGTSSVFIKPLKKKQLSITKAPHRFKLSRHLVYFSRYEVLVSINFTKTYNFGNIYVVKTFLEKIAALFKKIDSSICYQKLLKITINFSSKNILK